MTCAQFKISINDRLGRFVLATAPIKRGTILLQEPPLIQGPFLHSVPVCVGCGKPLDETSQPCGQCGWPLCGQHCQDSPNHASECLLTSSRGGITIRNFGVPNPNYQFIVILRALHLKHSNAEKWLELMTLQANPNNSQLPPASFMKTFFKLNDWSEQEIETVYGVLGTNAHELPMGQSAQLALYVLGSLFEHNCTPNCSKTFSNDGELIIVAARDIAPGDHLTISYCEALWGTQNRRQYLLQSKYFDCTCARCNDVTELGTHLSSLKCLGTYNCSGYVLPPSFSSSHDWRCLTCDDVVPASDVESILGDIGMKLIRIPKEDPDACKEFLTKYQEVLAANHFYLVEVKLVLVQMLASKGFGELGKYELGLVLDLVEELIKIAGTVACAEQRLLGVLYNMKGKALLEQCRRIGDVTSPDFFAKILMVKEVLTTSKEYLKYEPTKLEEGKLRLQIELEMKQIDRLLHKNEK